MRKFSLFAVAIILFLFPINSGATAFNSGYFEMDSTLQQTGTYTVIRDDVTGELVEHYDEYDIPRAALDTAGPAPIQIGTVKDIYLPLKELANNFGNSITFTYKVNSPDGFNVEAHKTEINSAIEKLLNDGSYASGVLHEYGYSFTYWPGISTKVELEISLGYNHTVVQEQELTTALDGIAAMIRQSAETDLDKVLAVNDFITRTYSYSFDTKWTPHSPYTMVTEGKGVCQAYALVAQRLLEELGMESYYQTGQIIGGELHAWNVVKVDGEWYKFDTTWNDPLEDRKGQTSYDYLLVSDKILAESRVWNDYGLPAATSEKYDVLHPNNKFATYGASDSDNIYISVYSPVGNTIKAFNKKTMEEIHYENLGLGRLLVDHQESLFFFNPYRQTTLYVWNRVADQATELDNGDFDQLYIEGDYLRYREIGSGNIKSLLLDDVIYKPDVDQASAAEVESLINKIEVISSTFRQDVESATAAYESLNDRARLLVVNYDLLLGYIQQLSDYDAYEQYIKDMKDAAVAINNAILAIQFKMETIEQDLEMIEQMMEEASLKFGIEYKKHVTEIGTFLTHQEKVMKYKTWAETIDNSLLALDKESASFADELQKVIEAKNQMIKLNGIDFLFFMKQKALLEEYTAMLPTADELAAANVDKLINEIISDSPTFRQDVEAAAIAYEALSKQAKTYVVNYALLLEYLQYLAEQDANENQIKLMQNAAKTIDNAIEALEFKVETIELGLKSIDELMHRANEEFGDAYLQYLTNTNILTGHREMLTKYKQLSKSLDDLIIALDKESPSFSKDLQSVLDKKEEIIRTHGVDALFFVQQKVLLEEYIALIGIDKQAAAVTALIELLDQYASDFGNALANANKQYEALSESAKQLVSNSDKLVEMNRLYANRDLVRKTFEHYKQWTKELTSTDAMKPWTISFNGEVGILTGTPISVLNSYGEDVEGIKIETNDNTIVITPTNPYRLNHTYYIVVNDTIQNTEGTKLKQGVLAEFVVTEK